MGEHKTYVGDRPRGKAWRRSDLDNVYDALMRGPEPFVYEPDGTKVRNAHPRLKWPTGHNRGSR